MDLTINGTLHIVDLPLLWALGDGLNITSVKSGCGIAQCGACTVHIGGEAVRSCQVALADVWGGITTIEGLGSAGALHVIQAAWIDHQVAQCGYCQSGEMMQAADLLGRNPEPTDDDIDATKSGNLCRREGWAHLTPSQAAAHEYQLFAEGSWGGDWYDGFGPETGDIVVTEHWGASSFANTCIETSARFAVELGYHVTLDRDATAAMSTDAMQAAHEINGPTFAHAILTTAEVVGKLSAEDAW